MISIANATPRNTESVCVPDLIPSALAESAKTLVDLLQSYYDYLNKEGLPSNEISSISSLKDIDRKSSKYLDQIEALIGKNVPNSRVLDKIELYKIIVKYYNTRGSEDSIHTFFKIFFNEIVRVFYPKDSLFNLSQGGGYWSGDDLFETEGDALLYRKSADVASKEINSIIFTPKNEGRNSGHLISVKFNEVDPSSFETLVENSNGILTITPAGKSRLLIDATSVSNGTVTVEVPEVFYYDGISSGRPRFSSVLSGAFAEDATPSIIEWSFGEWSLFVPPNFALGLPLISFSSSDDVADPTLVNTWTLAPTFFPPPSGSITDIQYSSDVNAQCYTACLDFDGEEFNIEFSYRESSIFEQALPTERQFLSSFPLPTTEDIEIGTIAVANQGERPLIFGSYDLIDGSPLWNRYLVEEWTHTDNKSFASDQIKIFDGFYWQDYSYVIKSNLDASAWYDDYLKFIHPAGLRMFSAITLEIFARNEWFNEIDYTAYDIENDYTWLDSFLPPFETFGRHSPKYQPGYLRDRLLRFIYMYLHSVDDAPLIRLMLLSVSFTLSPVNTRDLYVRKQYQTTDKFLDECRLCEGWLDRKIIDAIEEYQDTNSCRLLNLSVYVNVGKIFDESFLDNEFGLGNAEWDYSYVDDESGTGFGSYDSSFIEALPTTNIFDWGSSVFSEDGGDGDATWSSSITNDDLGEGDATWSESSYETL